MSSRRELGTSANVLRKLTGPENTNTDLKLQVWVSQLVSGATRLIEDHKQVEWLNTSQLWSPD